ncbi:MAG: hypothetical protein CVU03_13985 [Bacteroidetes bacterium HGW-Bacteroidetes-2]|jgi:YD repeat-containing protein|nr:MAG: hypothetical protein CVU03_13985 [Bacteroidetes bacterium HGW-Bacteroidetes-2]
MEKIFIFLDLMNLIKYNKMKIYLALLMLFISAMGLAQLEKKKTFHINGNLKKVYYVNESGLEEGKDMEYYHDGVTKEITLWNNGMLRDSIVKYNPNGEIFSIGYVKNDSLVFYKTTGTKEYEVALKEGRQNGTAVYYNEEGKIIGFNEFVNGEKKGYIIHLDEQTKFPKYIADYRDKGHGLLMSFYDNGHIKQIRTADTFSDGKVIDFHDNGMIKEIVNTVEGRSDGWKFAYDREGNLIEKTLYREGQVVKEK